MKNIEQETKFMIVCKFSPKIIISMNFEIVVLKNKDNFQIDSKYSLQYSSEIVQLKMSENEKVLAVAVAPQSD